jgi:hypothetical protein
MSAEHADGVRLAHVEVDSPGGRSVVTLSFYGDLTPVEATAAFLRDLADVVVTGSGVLLEVAEQLERARGSAPPAAPPRAPSATFHPQGTVIPDGSS